MITTFYNMQAVNSYYLDDSIHQLRTYEIMHDVFEYLCVSDLKNARLVCSLWNQVAMPYLGEKSVVKLYGSSCSPRTLEKFLQQRQSTLTSDMFFRNYILIDWNIESNRRMTKFWKEYGPKMKSLEVFRGKFAGSDIVRNIFCWTPKLKTLSFRNCCFIEGLDERVGSNPRAGVAFRTNRYIKINRNLKSLSFEQCLRCTNYLALAVAWNEICLAYPNVKEIFLNNCALQDRSEWRVFERMPQPQLKPFISTRI